MNKPFKRVHLVVIDSVGIGEAPDAKKFGDVDVDTLGNIAKTNNGLKIPNMVKLGLTQIRALHNIPQCEAPIGYYGKMEEVSAGKDTMTGHWEIMGLYIDTPFRVFPNGFPAELIQRIEQFSGRKVIGNIPASGTEIIENLGEEQMKTGALIVYTSADSVLQIAANEEVIPLEELYKVCEFCREITREDPYMLGRIIARPFVGNSKETFKRTANRHDYALKPFGRTVMNELADAKLDVIALGKIADIYDGEGVTESIKTISNEDGMNKLIHLMNKDFTGLSFLNLVDFDALYGHRRDPIGYGKALEEFDVQLAELLSKLQQDDLLIITADHGNDPTAPGSDHTREYVPLLAYSKRFNKGKDLGILKSFAALGATVADNFQVALPEHGKSFLSQLD